VLIAQFRYEFIIIEEPCYILFGGACLYRNRYHGKGYHGGSASIHKIDEWLGEVQKIIDIK